MNAGGNLQARQRHTLDAIDVQPLGEGRIGRRGKAGPPASAAISKQRELADDQNAAANVENTSIHLTRVVLKPTQVQNFVGDPGRIFLGVALSDPEQHQPTALDAADADSIDLDRRPAHSL